MLFYLFAKISCLRGVKGAAPYEVMRSFLHFPSIRKLNNTFFMKVLCLLSFKKVGGDANFGKLSLSLPFAVTFSSELLFTNRQKCGILISVYINIEESQGAT